MQKVALDVNQDVSVVSVFDLQDVADERVGGKTVTEVFAGLLEAS